MDPLNNKVTGSTLTAAQWNQVASELQNVITSAGITLTGADLAQLARGVAGYVANGTFYLSAFSDPNYALTVSATTPLSNPATKFSPPAYVDGMIVRFFADATNTANTTLSLPGLAAQDVRDFDGAALVGGEIFVGQLVEVIYRDVTTNFRLIQVPEVSSDFKNLVMNGDFEVWQRNVSVIGLLTSGQFISDRWFNDPRGGVANVIRTNFVYPQTDVPDSPTFHMAYNQTFQGVSSTVPIRQRIENVGTLAGKIVTLSMYLRVNVSKDFEFFIEQNYGSGGSPGTNVTYTSPSFTVGTTFQRFSFTTTLDPLNGPPGTAIDHFLEISLREFAIIPSTYDLDISHVQMEASPSPTSFGTRVFATEQDLCFRFYQNSYSREFNIGFPTLDGSVIGQAVKLDLFLYSVRFFTKMQKIPLVRIFATATGDLGQMSLDPLGTPSNIPATVALGTEGESGFTAESTDAAIDPGNTFGFHYDADAEF